MWVFLKYNDNMEIERKWLIDKNNIPFNLNDYESFDINQAYISFSPTIRIRRIVNKNEYVLTIKSKSKDDISREEYEININEKEYEELIQKKEGIVISKTRYKVPFDSHILEIDIFHDDYEGLAYLEIEFDSIEEANAYTGPSWVIKEVTHDHMYSNSSLAKKKFIL